MSRGVVVDEDDDTPPLQVLTPQLLGKEDRKNLGLPHELTTGPAFLPVTAAEHAGEKNRNQPADTSQGGGRG